MPQKFIWKIFNSSWECKEIDYIDQRMKQAYQNVKFHSTSKVLYLYGEEKKRSQNMQRNAIKILRSLKNISYDEQLRETELLILE